jgi:hypothetical protein
VTSVKATNMHSTFCKGRIVEIFDHLDKDGMGIAVTNSSEMEYILVAYSQEDFLANEQAHADN